MSKSDAGLCCVREPWYQRFIPDAVRHQWYTFKTRNDMSAYEAHARREMRNMLADDADEMDKLMAEQVIELLRVFSKHGHSGFSAPYAITMFSTLAKFEPLGPLTGADDEWNHVGDQGGTNTVGSTIYQNNRASHVFKEVFEDDTPDYVYDINGKVFREEDGCCYTNRKSRVEITFPYTPTTAYVDVDVDGNELV